MLKPTNEDLSKKFIDLWEKGKTEYFEEIFSSEFDHHVNGTSTKGIAAYKDYYNNFIKTFKDVKFTIEEKIYATDDSIIFRWSGQGTFAGEFHGCPPSHKEIQFSGLTLLHVKDGKITAGWFYNDLPEVLCACKECK